MMLVNACANVSSLGKFDALQDELPAAAQELNDALLDCTHPDCDESVVAGANLLDLLDEVFNLNGE